MNNSANQDIVNALEEVNQKCIEELHKIYAEVSEKTKKYIKTPEEAWRMTEWYKVIEKLKLKYSNNEQSRNSKSDENTAQVS